MNNTYEIQNYILECNMYARLLIIHQFDLLHLFLIITNWYLFFIGFYFIVVALVYFIGREFVNINVNCCHGNFHQCFDA